MGLLDVLTDEHRGLVTMLGVMDAVALRVRKGDGVPPGMLTGLLDFFEFFTDGHHVQEEQLLFPLLAEHGIGRDQTVVNALLAQHEAGRSYGRKMRADLSQMSAGDPEARLRFADHAQGYVELIREHIRIEDTYFYQVAEEILTHAEKARITEAFSRAKGRRVPEQERDRYLQMIREYPVIVAGWSKAAGSA
jgi:hemerythrin-like domain-containing protein